MNGVIRRYRFLGTYLIIVVLAALQGCAGNQDRYVDDPNGAPVGWDSSQMQGIEKEWQSLQGDYIKDTKGNPGKSEYSKLLDSVDRLFRSQLSKQSTRHLAANSEKVPVLADDRSPFVNEVIAFTVKALVELGDRESLIELLSKRCPSRISWPDNIEYHLAFRGRKLKDPILVLGEAYAKCQVPETRHILAAAVRRSFAGCGIFGKDDAEWVNNAMQWYLKEKDNLVANNEYFMNEIDGIHPFTIEIYEDNPRLYDNPPADRRPLFKRK